MRANKGRFAAAKAVADSTVALAVVDSVEADGSAADRH